MAIDPERVKALFQAAIERSDLADRQAFLDGEAGDNVELRDRLDALLAAYDQPPEALDRPLGVDPDATDGLDATRSASPGPTWETTENGARAGRPRDAGPEVIDTIIADRYKIRQEIGEGGMGAVYFAEQLRPVRRTVALKLIKRGMDSKNVLARFEQERQALALMEHPNIARVLDAGTTDDGRPFFVMELVKGIPITDYCDQRRLDVPARLALFRQVCHAVQHAHQKGIIHRDLKPSNILVESHDDKPVPKVIDFGLAKATSGLRLSEQSLFTGFGNVAGTPLYMAPEQASWSAMDIDTRADIYALGVVLYELLTGTTPITRDTMRQAAIDEMLRVVRQVEPPTPSSRVSTSEALPSLAAMRGVEPGRLSRLMRGDLDWVVMKALAKERERRYASAAGLADDLEKYLHHEPVSAGPPTAAYRLRKFVRRNRAQVTAAAVVLLALVLGVVGTTLGLLEARRQERIAVREAAAKEQARLAEAEQRRAAEKRLTQVTKMNDILGSIFRDLDPKNAAKDGKPLSAVLGERLDRATAEIEGEATGDPLMVARMQLTLGESQLGLGYPDRAMKLFKNARATFTAKLGLDHPDTLRSMNNLANSHQAAGRNDQAMKLYEETLALEKAKLGPDHPDTLGSMNKLAGSYSLAGRNDQAMKLLEETLALQKAKLGPDHPDTLRSMNNLANCYRGAGKNDQAMKLYEETLALRKAKLGSDHPETLRSMNNLALCYSAAGWNDRALKLLEETLALQKAKLGPDHPDTLRSMNNLANRYNAVGRIDRAMKIQEETLALMKAKLGTDHPDTLANMGNLAGSYAAAGRNDEALRLNEETLALQKAKLGPDHPDILKSMNNLANSYNAAGRIDRAMKIHEEALTLRKSKVGLDHPDTLSSMQNLAAGYAAAGRNDQAMKLIEETLALQKAKLGPDHPDTLKSMNNLANSYFVAGRKDQALKLYEETLTLRKAKLGLDHPDTLGSMQNLAGSYAAAGRNDQAMKLFEETLELMKAKLGPDHPYTLGTMGNLATCYFNTGRKDRALKLHEETLALKRSKLGPDHPYTLVTMRDLADAYERSGRTREAIPLLAKLPVVTADDMITGIKLATLEAWFGLTTEFAADRKRFLAAAKDSTDPLMLDRVAEACSLLPSADPADLEASLALARKAVELDRGGSRNLPALGMAEFRQGDFAAAEKTLSEAAKSDANNASVVGIASFYRAMSLFRQGKIDDAKKLAAETAAAMKPLPADHQNPLAGEAKHDDLILWLAFKEAKTMIPFDDKSTGDAKPAPKSGSEKP